MPEFRGSSGLIDITAVRSFHWHNNLIWLKVQTRCCLFINPDNLVFWSVILVLRPHGHFPKHLDKRWSLEIGRMYFHTAPLLLSQITLSGKTKQLPENFRLKPCLLKLPGKLAADSTVNYSRLQKLLSGVERQERQRTNGVKFSIHALNELESENNGWQGAGVTQITELVTCQSMTGSSTVHTVSLNNAPKEQVHNQ